MSARLLVIALIAGLTSPGLAQKPTPPTRSQLQSDVQSLRDELGAARALLAGQEERLRALEARLAEQQTVIAALPPAAANGSGRANGSGIERVGEAPVDFDRPPELAVLGMEGSVVTRRGQLTAEGTLEYTRADRNRAVFRGIELVESVLVGVFDINESRQDVLTAAAGLRYGVTDRLELGARIPFVYRSDKSVRAPVAGSTNNDPAATIDSSANGSGLGDIELAARYQLVGARGGWPFIIANLQGVIPTGTNPFKVPRDELGRAREAATGAGFYGISPSVTAILPTDPGVLFGTIGYTWNLPRDVNTLIPPVQIDRVDPGDAVSASAGLGIALNQRTSFNLGYAHSWAFGTKTWTRMIASDGSMGDILTTRSRDLQIGRFLFGITHRISNRASLNWSVEVGATADAPDVRTVLRIPLTVSPGN